MDEGFSDSYFDNILLVKLVSSAEALLQHLYETTSYENKQFIDQWLCSKQEFDACSSVKLDLNVEANSDLIHAHDALSDTGTSNYSFIEDDADCGIRKSCSKSSDSVEEASENDDELSDETSRNLLSSGFESGSQNILDQYSKNFKFHTETLISGWLDNLNLDSIKNSCGDHVDNQRFNCFSQDALYQTGNSSNAFQPLDKEVSSLRFCHCCANETVNCYSILLLPMEEQISYLRELKTPLIYACQKITSHSKRCDFENTNKQLIMLQEILDILDTSMEMKNYDRMADLEMENFICSDQLPYSTVLNCFKMLSSNEMHYLFIYFLNKVVTLRENSSTLDKLILKLDNTIVDREIRLRYLNENYSKLRNTYSSLRNKTPPVVKESVTENPSAAKPLSESNNSQKSIGEDESSSSHFLRNLPNRSIKALQRNTSSKSFGVTRLGNKLIIQQNKNS